MRWWMSTIDQMRWGAVMQKKGDAFHSWDVMILNGTGWIIHILTHNAAKLCKVTLTDRVRMGCFTRILLSNSKTSLMQPTIRHPDMGWFRSGLILSSVSKWTALEILYSVSVCHQLDDALKDGWGKWYWVVSSQKICLKISPMICVYSCLCSG